MSNPFKVGDRAKCYEGNYEYRGDVISVTDRLVTVFSEINNEEVIFHHKQCRKLRKKRKPIVVEIRSNIGPSGFIQNTHAELVQLVGKKVKVRVEEIL